MVVRSVCTVLVRSACTELVRPLVRSLYGACTSNFQPGAHSGPFRTWGPSSLYELVQGVVRSASEQPLNKPIPLRR